MNQPESGLTWAVCRYISCLRGIFFLPFTLVLVSSFGMYSTRKYLCHRKYLYQRKYWFTHSLKYMFCGMDKQNVFTEICICPHRESLDKPAAFMPSFSSVTESINVLKRELQCLFTPVPLPLPLPLRFRVGTAFHPTESD